MLRGARRRFASRPAHACTYARALSSTGGARQKIKIRPTFEKTSVGDGVDESAAIQRVPGHKTGYKCAPQHSLPPAADCCVRYPAGAGPVECRASTGRLPTRRRSCASERERDARERVSR